MLDDKVFPRNNEIFMCWFFSSSRIPLLHINNENTKAFTLNWGNLISTKNKARLEIRLSVSTTDVKHGGLMGQAGNML